MFFRLQALCGLKGPHINIPWIRLNLYPGDHFGFHRIKKNITYRLWSPVYGGSNLLQRGPNNEVNCKGNFEDRNYDSKCHEVRPMRSVKRRKFPRFNDNCYPAYLYLYNW